MSKRELKRLALLARNQGEWEEGGTHPLVGTHGYLFVYVSWAIFGYKTVLFCRATEIGSYWLPPWTRWIRDMRKQLVAERRALKHETTAVAQKLAKQLLPRDDA